MATLMVDAVAVVATVVAPVAPAVAAPAPAVAVAVSALNRMSTLANVEQKRGLDC